MVAVAGAIIAQIAMTSLTLPYLSQTHWISRAFFILSVISGCLSVFFCVATQKIISTQYTPHEIRHWLTAPIPRRFLNSLERLNEFLVQSSERRGDRNFQGDLASYLESGQIQTLKAALMTKTPSILSVAVLSAPGFMLDISLSTLLLALGIYLGFIWTRNLDTNAGLHDSRNVFIFYIVGVLSMIAIYSVPNALKDSEERHQKVRKEVIDALDQIEKEKRSLVPRLPEELISRDEGKEGEAKELKDVKPLSEKAISDIGKVLEESIQAQEALLKANLALLAKIRGTSSGSNHSATAIL
ncbi:hypothetical protein BP5796_07696 [Coleophoma crateriformis]|uniref:Uncharacterized protein n=1 Tax=Coleophoma crateriformis TaxID=565419 RepID=A0A3D8RC92_9HELO|nr:hypothetical protein BP5796_07696 [Coleophoma crateriformis]